MTGRAVLLAGCMVVASAYLGHAAKAEPTPIRQPLSGLPLAVGEWRGRVEANFSKQILDILRVDDYTTRTYVSPRSGDVGLYVGYHATQRQGASIHSPLNCLPGSGWIPMGHAYLPLTVDSSIGGPKRDIVVNRVMIQKGLDRQVVLYWYQSQGRIVASEYWGKVYSVADAIRYNRTDAALVRVIAPVGGDSAADIAQAEQKAVAFTQSIFPLLGEYLPS
jgi:EpsI family protein